MDEPAFESVVAAAQAGAEWAWSRLYGDHAPAVFGYLRARGAADPENLLGEVFLQLARHLGGFSGTEVGFRAWVFQIAHHRLLDERRSARRRPADPVPEFADDAGGDPVDTTAETALAEVATARIRRLLARLAPDQQDVLLLRIVGALSVAEVAEALGKTTGAVKALQRRGLEALRRLLEAEGVPL